MVIFPYWFIESLFIYFSIALCESIIITATQSIIITSGTLCGSWAWKPFHVPRSCREIDSSLHDLP